MTSLSGKALIGAIIKDDINNRYPNALSDDKDNKPDYISYANYLTISFK